MYLLCRVVWRAVDDGDRGDVRELILSLWPCSTAAGTCLEEKQSPQMIDCLTDFRDVEVALVKEEEEPSAIRCRETCSGQVSCRMASLVTMFYMILHVNCQYVQTRFKRTNSMFSWYLYAHYL